ncbi:MAG TPA: hypothetical protein VFX86_04305 [Candidatus Saccharimonadales bacterium]|nr:hypothetical protein [Candidatus Saccharimonadales bacterium]
MTAKKQVIAVDLDDVLSINIPAFIRFSNQKWGTNLTLEGYQENWMGMWDIDERTLAERSEVIRREFWHTLEHSGEALPVLQTLSKKYKLVIATSRRREMKQPTKEWIDRYFNGIFEEVHHAGIFDNQRGDIASKVTKARLYREIGADFIIDDHAKHCIGADKIGVQALLFGDYPWNKAAVLPDTITRVKDWKEVGEYFAKRN